MNVFDSNQYKAIFFDMDGIFVETEMLHYQAFYDLLKPLGVEMTVEYFYGLVGVPTSKNFVDIVHDFNLNIDVQEWKKRLSDKILETLSEAEIIPIAGIVEIIGFARKRGIRLGLVTTSSRHQFEIVINSVRRSKNPLLNDHIFDVTVTGEEVIHKKPCPDPYISAASRLNISPSACIVLEDSEAGIASAKSAGCYCIARRTEYNAHMDFSRADWVVSSILQVAQALPLESPS